MQVQLIQTYDGSGDMILPLGEDLCKDLGWVEGDVLIWKENGDKSFSVSKKKEKKYILVESISTFRIRNVVEVNDESEDGLATDAALYNNILDEFGQKHIGQTIVSTRVVEKEELLGLYQEDNSYGTQFMVDKSIIRIE